MKKIIIDKYIMKKKMKSKVVLFLFKKLIKKLPIKLFFLNDISRLIIFLLKTKRIHAKILTECPIVLCQISCHILISFGKLVQKQNHEIC